MRFAAVLLLISGTSFAQVQNAADADAGVFASSVVAPGSQAFVTDQIAGAVPTSVNGVAVAIRPVGSSTAIPAQVLGGSITGITFFVPPDTPLGNAQLIYNKAGQLTQSTSISIGPGHLALFRGSTKPMNINASGPATANGLANPAQPRQGLEILATGLGSIPLFGPQVTLGGVSQSVTHAGADGSGLLEIDIQISPDTPDGCYVPLTVTWGGNTASLMISKTSDGMACHHPFGLSTQTLQALDSGGSVETGMISMTTALTAASADHASRSEQAVVSFTNLSASQIAHYFGAGPAPACSASGGSAGGIILNGNFGGAPSETTMTLQSGATTLTLGGVFEYSITIPPTADAPLNHLPAPVIGGGAWTWSSSVIGQFTFNVSPPLQINGGAPIRIQTNQNQTITWNGSGFDSSAILQLSLSATNFGPAGITCFAPAQAGSLMIPANLLSRFSPGGVGTLAASAFESGAGMPNANFQLSEMLVSRSSTDTRPVDFQ